MTPHHNEKTCLFVRFFHVQPKHQNGNIFVDIEGFRPSCLSKPSYRAPKWALMVRLMQKERLKSPQKSLILETRPFGSFGPFCPKWPFWSFWPAVRRSVMVCCVQGSATCFIASSLAANCVRASERDDSSSVSAASALLIRMMVLFSSTRTRRVRAEPPRPAASRATPPASTWRLSVSAFISADDKGAASPCSARTHPFKSRWISIDSPANSSFSDCETDIRSISIGRCALMMMN